MGGRVAMVVPLLLLLAGCLDASTGEDSEASELEVVGPGDYDTELVVHVAGAEGPGTVPADPVTVRLSPIGYSRGEPTLGVTSDGSIFVTATTDRLARSMDHGLTWEAVGSDVFSPKVDFDPWMWVDTATDRVFHAPLYIVCTWAAWSDDLGESWLANPVAGCGIPAHDHQKLTTGAPAPGVVTNPLWERVIYYSYNSFRGEGTVISTSYDGGFTYTPGVVAHPSDCHGGVAGGVTVAPDGTAYHTKPACEGVNIARSLDSGQSWQIVAEVNDHGVLGALAVNPETVVDDEGNVYAIWPGQDGHVYMVTSQDGGESWSTPVRVDPPHITFTQFTVGAASAPGHIAIGYHATDANTSKWLNNDGEQVNNPSYADDNTTWHTYISTTQNAFDASPSFVTKRVNPYDDPTQVGCIWLHGGGSACRNLLDFIDMVEYDGRPYMVYADGCPACQFAEESRARNIVVAMVEIGPSLDGGLLEPLVDLDSVDPSLVN